LELVCNVDIVYENLKSENSQDFALKPYQNYMSMNSASGADLLTNSIYLCYSTILPNVKLALFNKAKAGSAWTLAKSILDPDPQ
jgi:hypothetical protein